MMVVISKEKKEELRKKVGELNLDEDRGKEELRKMIDELNLDEKQTIKIVTLSGEGCLPCKDLQQEIAALSGKYDINLVVVDATSLVDDPKGLQPDTIPEAFGQVDVVPTTIIETAERSEKLVGYTEGELERVIEDVLKEPERTKAFEEFQEEYTRSREEDIKAQKEEDNDG